jgi:hypothetical protein
MCVEFDETGRMAAMGGFSSKMGLASGPLAAAFMLGENNYTLLINVAVVALALCVAVVVPGLHLDRKGQAV